MILPSPLVYHVLMFREKEADKPGKIDKAMAAKKTRRSYKEGLR